ncbi:MAG TPA: hypothetical protein VG347_09805 [Verrucomicrobiae bacterium]|nr:hypothetical protein [Verrucomicrobiae bacterium]
MQPAIKVFVLVAIFALVLPLHAVPITGALSFSGTATLDGSTGDTSTRVKTWNSATVDSAFGSFAGLNGHAVTVSAPWDFYSGAINNFWNVGGFQYNLSSSATFDDFNGVLTVILTGTVTDGSYDPTHFLGRVKIYDPATVGGDFKYTQSLDFITVPDGGITIVFLSLTMGGLFFARRYAVVR